MQIMFDLEMQRELKSAYPICYRAQYYVAGMLSSVLVKVGKSQKGHNNLYPAYSVWIIRDTPQKYTETIAQYSMWDVSGNEITEPRVHFNLPEDLESPSRPLFHVVMAYLPRFSKNVKADDDLVNFINRCCMASLMILSTWSR